MRVLIAFSFLAIILLSCKEQKPLTSEEILHNFYSQYKNHDFSKFQCFILTDRNRTVSNRGDSYILQYYQNCEKENTFPLKGEVTYSGDSFTYTSEKLPKQDLPDGILAEFRALELASLNYKNHRQIVFSPVPEVVIMKRCGPADPGYLSLDNCWHYKVLK